MNAKKLLCGLFAVFALVGVTACQQVITPNVESLSISGYDTEFTVGDTFDDGELVVTAKYTDETTKDVTAEATVTQNADMSTPGSYAVLVSFGGQTVAYQITVNAKENTKTLEFLAADTTDAKLTYTIGETVSYEGLKVYEVYSNTEMGETAEEVTDYTGKVYDVNGDEVTSKFYVAGNYTVVVTKGELTDAYTISVNKPEVTSVADAIEYGVANADKVNGGTLVETNESYSDYYGETMTSEVVNNYAYGENYFTNSYVDIYETSYEYHYSLIDEETVFGVLLTDGSVGQAYDPVVENVHGVALTVLGYSYTFYGADGLVAGLYDVATEAEVTPTESVKDGVYSYSYQLAVWQYDNTDWETGEVLNSVYYYYDVAVSFTLGNALEIDNAEVSIANYYTSDNLVLAEDGSWTVNEETYGADSTVTYAFTQEQGAQVAENSYSAEDMLYSSFDLVDANGEVYAEGEHDILSGSDNKVELSIDNPTPETAVAILDTITVTVTDENGDVSYDLGAYYSDWYGTLTITGRVAGTFTVTVESTYVTKSYTFNVTLADPTSITAEVYGDTGYGYDAFNEKTSHTMYLGQTLYVKASTPEYTNSGYTAQLGNAAMMACTLEATTVDGEDCYLLTANGYGDFPIMFASTANPDVYTILTVSVVPAPAISDVLNGTHEYTDSYSSNSGKIVFTPAEEGATNGTLAFEYSEYSYFTWSYVTYEGEFTYSYADGNITLTPVGEYDFTLELSITSSYTVKAVIDGYTTVSFVKTVVVEEDTTDVEYNGTWSGTDSYGWTMTIVFDELFGTATISETNGEEVNTGVYEYGASGSGVEFTYVSGYNFFDMGLEFTANGSVIEVSSYGVVYYELTAEASDDEDGETVVEGDGSDSNPYVITGTTDITCEFPGGWNYIFYSYTADSACEVTISITSNDYYWGYGPAAYELENVGNSVPSKTISLAAGETVLIGMSTDSTDAANITFSVTVE